MFNKKGQVATDTPIILSILVFQAFILICLGFLDINSGYVTTESGSSIFSFGNIITNIVILGWGNLLIFTPLTICLTYIIVKVIRGGG